MMVILGISLNSPFYCDIIVVLAKQENDKNAPQKEMQKLSHLLTKIHRKTIRAYNFTIGVWQSFICKFCEYPDMHNLSGSSFKVTASQTFIT